MSRLRLGEQGVLTLGWKQARCQETMTRSDLQRMADCLPADYGELADALRGELVCSTSDVPERGAYTRLKSQKVVIYRFPEDKLTVAVYAHFKTTEWLLQAGPDILTPVPGELTVTMFERVPLYRPLPESGICYHATEISKRSKIEKEGLRIGIHCGQHPRDNRFPDSIYYIYAADGLDAAWAWCKRLHSAAEFIVFPIRIREAGYRWFADPCGGDASAFIIEADHIPPQFLMSVISS